jgi:hypothetical protein
MAHEPTEKILKNVLHHSWPNAPAPVGDGSGDRAEHSNLQRLR